ncbi:MAG: hypothetical protein LUD72_08335 [Bacteroidales bacterium]|nr:hypothetical protein [Bacteroidales bacterium]
MANKKPTFLITEEQYDMAIKEGIVLNADLAAANGDVNKAVTTTRQQAQQSGVNLDDASIQLPASTTESVLITKDQLKEARRKALYAKSKLYTAEEFNKLLRR